MQVIIIGGVAAGTKTAAKLKRELSDAHVTILTKSQEISYAGCGLPYYLGGVIRDREALIVNTPEKFRMLTGVQVETGTEVIGVHPADKCVEAVRDGETFFRSYDKLVIATGAYPFKPEVTNGNLPGIFCMRTPEDAAAIREYIRDNECKRAVVVGGGFIGLEVAENLCRLEDIRVTVMEGSEQILPGFSPDIAGYVKDRLVESGIRVMTGAMLQGFAGEARVEKVLTAGKAIKADVVILSIGIRPNTSFLKSSGVALYPNGTVQVNRYFETSVKDIYAVGDCISVWNRVSGKPEWSPMGSSANLEGRICARNIAGEKIAYPGTLRTAICRLPGVNVGKTGFTKAAAQTEGMNPVSVTIVADDKAHYYPGAESMVIKMVADKTTGRFLGVEAIGKGPVDKIIDIGVTALSLSANLDSLDNMDLAYAPPFSTAIHPFVLAVQVLKNKVDGKMDSIGPDEFGTGRYDGFQIVDASLSPAIAGAPFMDYSRVTGPVDEFSKDANLMLVCTKGKRAYLLQNTLRHYGYRNTKVLEAGTAFNGTELVKN